MRQKLNYSITPHPAKGWQHEWIEFALVCGVNSIIILFPSYAYFTNKHLFEAELCSQTLKLGQ